MSRLQEVPILCICFPNPGNLFQGKVLFVECYSSLTIANVSSLFLFFRFGKVLLVLFFVFQLFACIILRFVGRGRKGN